MTGLMQVGGMFLGIKLLVLLDPDARERAGSRWHLATVGLAVAAFTVGAIFR